MTAYLEHVLCISCVRAEAEAELVKLRMSRGMLCMHVRNDAMHVHRT